jgi:hypothetical protein
MADETTTEQNEQELPTGLGTSELRAAQRIARDISQTASRVRKALSKFGKLPTVRGSIKSELLTTIEALRALEVEASTIFVASRRMIAGAASTEDPEAAAFADGYRDYAVDIAADLDWVMVPEDALVIPAVEGDGAYVEAFLWIDAEDVEDDEDAAEGDDEDDLDDDEDDEDDGEFDEDDDLDDEDDDLDDEE